MNYFNFHLGDYAKSTGHLSPLEHGMYLLLLAHYYATEAPIPSPPSSTARICRAVTDDERAAVAAVLRMFFHEKDGAYHNDRVDKEISAYKSKSAKAEAAGRASGEARRLKHSEKSERPFNVRSTSVPLELNNPNNQEPITSVLLVKEPNPRGRGRVDDEEDFAAASAHQLDLTASPKLKAAWLEWQAYRQRRHRAKGRDRLKWTLQAAHLSARQLIAAAAEHGEQIAADRISSAIVGNWQGLNFDKLNGSGPRLPATPNGAPPKFNLF